MLFSIDISGPDLYVNFLYNYTSIFEAVSIFRRCKINKIINNNINFNIKKRLHGPNKIIGILNNAMSIKNQA